MHLVEEFPVMSDIRRETTDVRMSTHVSITESSNMHQVVIVDEDHVTVRHSLCMCKNRLYVRSSKCRASYSLRQYNPITREEDPGTLKPQMKARSVNKRISPSWKQGLV